MAISKCYCNILLQACFVCILLPALGFFALPQSATKNTDELITRVYTDLSPTVDNAVSSTSNFSPGIGPGSLHGGVSADEVLVFDKMRVPRWLAETVVRAAQTTDVDPAFMMALADK